MDKILPTADGQLRAHMIWILGYFTSKNVGDQKDTNWMTWRPYKSYEVWCCRILQKIMWGLLLFHQFSSVGPKTSLQWPYSFVISQSNNYFYCCSINVLIHLYLIEVAEVIFAITSAVKDVCKSPITERHFLDRYGKVCLCLDEIVWKVRFCCLHVFWCLLCTCWLWGASWHLWHKREGENIVVPLIFLLLHNTFTDL